MRVILSNDDARKLHALMTAHPDIAWDFEFLGGSDAQIIFAGEKFKAKLRATPSARGSFVIEDFDGRRIMEGLPDPDDDA
jgi:hypothetical protein